MLQLFPIVVVLQLPPLIQVAYLGLCMLVAGFGRKKVMGFWGLFFGSIILSPIIGLLLLIVSKNRSPRQPKGKPVKMPADKTVTAPKV